MLLHSRPWTGLHSAVSYLPEFKETLTKTVNKTRSLSHLTRDVLLVNAMLVVHFIFLRIRLLRSKPLQWAVLELPFICTLFKSKLNTCVCINFFPFSTKEIHCGVFVHRPRPPKTNKSKMTFKPILLASLHSVYANSKCRRQPWAEQAWWVWETQQMPGTFINGGSIILVKVTRLGTTFLNPLKASRGGVLFTQ